LITQLIAELQEQLILENLEVDEEREEVIEVNSNYAQVAKDITISKKVARQSGDGNDYVEFGIRFDLNPFQDDVFVSQNPISFGYSVTKSGTNVYQTNGQKNGSSTALLSSANPLENDYYRISQNYSRQPFEFDITYYPYADEGTPPGSGSYRIQLDSIEYSLTPGGQTAEIDLRNNNSFTSSSALVQD
jgi:hypothetical protein